VTHRKKKKKKLPNIRLTRFSGEQYRIGQNIVFSGHLCRDIVAVVVKIGLFLPISKIPLLLWSEIE
jgi:hypothetical protein